MVVTVTQKSLEGCSYEVTDPSVSQPDLEMYK